MSVLKEQVSSSSDCSSFSSVISSNTSVSCSLCIFYFGQKDHMKKPILTLSSVVKTIWQIPQVIFQIRSQFFFKFCVTLHCHEIYPSVLFYVKRCILCKKGTNQSGNGSDFLVVGSKFSKFFSFLKENINLYSNFVPLFGIMRHIYSILFLAKTLYTFSKSSLSKYKFGTNHIVSATNVQKAYLSWQRRVMQSLKKKLTCCFKYGRRNLVTFNPCTQKFEDFTSAGYFCPKYRRFEQKKNTEELFFMTLNSNAKFE